MEAKDSEKLCGEKLNENYERNSEAIMEKDYLPAQSTRDTSTKSFERCISSLYGAAVF